MTAQIAQLSDLHFGREDRAVVEGLLRDLREQNPSLIVVSGDLTQRARSSEFSAAKDFLASIPLPKLIVPGNHDVPLWHFWERFLYPFRRYKIHIATEFNPFCDAPPFAIIGINSVAPRRWKEGVISRSEFDRVKAILKNAPAGRIRILVMHHPMVEDLRRAANQKWFEELGIRIILSGHRHQENSEDLPHAGTLLGQSILWVQAGTAISERIRGEPNSYNLISLENQTLIVATREWTNGKFELKLRREFPLTMVAKSGAV